MLRSTDLHIGHFSDQLLEESFEAVIRPDYLLEGDCFHGDWLSVLFIEPEVDLSESPPAKFLLLAEHIASRLYFF